MRKIEAQTIQTVRNLASGTPLADCQKKIGSNTTVAHRSEGIYGTFSFNRWIEVALHGHTIVKIYPATGRIYARDCGWQTVTTKSRINCILKAFCGNTIQQSKFEWFLSNDGTRFESGHDWQECGIYRLDYDNWALRCAEKIAA